MIMKTGVYVRQTRKKRWLTVFLTVVYKLKWGLNAIQWSLIMLPTAPDSVEFVCYTQSFANCLELSTDKTDKVRWDGV